MDLAQWNFTAPFEGIVPHLYLDTAGVMTCGVGFAVPSVAELVKLPWWPNAFEAQADYRIVRGQPAGRVASFYAPLCKARLLSNGMQAVFAARVAEFRRNMRDWSLERQPLPVQLALVDMAYNLGAGGLSKFAKLRAAVNARDWSTAAVESHRNGVQQARNDATRDLFLSAKTSA